MNKMAVESDMRKEKGLFVNVTNDREAYPKRWLAALVHSACIITNKCKQLDKNVDIDSLERIEINLQQLQKAN